MKTKLLTLCVMFSLVVSAKADPRYIIIEKVGRSGVEWAQPSYLTVEGQRNVKAFHRASSHQFDGEDFWNENSKGLGVKCGFRADKSATVLVDANGEPVYLVGCRGGTFYNRIKLIRPEAPRQVRPVVQPTQTRRQVVYEEEEVSFRTGATYGTGGAYCPPTPSVRYGLPAPPMRQQRVHYCPPPPPAYCPPRVQYCAPPRPVCSPQMGGQYGYTRYYPSSRGIVAVRVGGR